jgi:16S rRNA processing protein RimM
VTAASPAAVEADWPADAVEVGRIVDAWGVKGWIKVQPFATDPQALFSTRRWFLGAPEDGGTARPPGAERTHPAVLRIIQAKEHGDVVVAQVHDVADRSAAEALRGTRIFVGRSSFPTAGDDEYYWIDLIGLTVVNRQGERLGTVAGLLDTGPHSVLRVALDAGSSGAPAEEGERLIPFVAAYVDDVSLEAKRITVDWGLDF